jgi:hypothetical protein
MPGSTPVYALPYQTLTDPPNGPDLGEDLAGAVETQLQRVDTDLSALRNPPVAQLRQTTQQTITNGVWSPVTFTTEDIDTHNGHDNAVNPSRYVCKLAGIYLVSGAVAYSSFTSGTGWVRVAKNGVEVPGSGDNELYTTTQLMVSVRPVYVTLAVGDYVELVTTYIGANINTYVGVNYAQSSLSLKWVHA